jgi:hypothetical protein
VWVEGSFGKEATMRPIRNDPSIAVVRTDALFVSAVQRSDEPRATAVREAVAAAVRRFGPQGCAERVAEEFGDHPDIAAARMRWARGQIAQVFGETCSCAHADRREGQTGGRAA